MTDQTARILAGQGNPVALAEYAIHQAYAEYRHATAGSEDVAVFDAAARQLKRALAGALITFDTTSSREDRETLLIFGARDRIAAMPLTAFEQWCRDVTSKPGRVSLVKAYVPALAMAS